MQNEVRNLGAANPNITLENMIKIVWEMGATTGIDTMGNTEVAVSDRETTVDISNVILH